MGLKEELFQLADLQTIDVKIYQLSQEKDVKIPESLQSLKNDFEAKKKSLNDINETIKQTQLRKKDKELDLSAKEESITKANASLNQLKTNKEYQAKMQEIASLKADVSLLDDEVLRILEEIENAEKKKKDIEAVLAEDEKKFQQETANLNSQIKEIDIQLKILQDKRNILSKDVDKKVLTQYDHLVKNRAGVAIAPINGEICGACYMTLTAQTINEAKMYRNLVICQSCGRILYIRQEDNQ